MARLWDALALLVIAFVAWKIFIAPRALKPAAYPAPNVAYKRLDGGTFHISDARGKVLFLDFYASWCEPCKLESPLIQRYARKHPEVRVVSVDVGEPRISAEAFAKRYNVSDVVLDPRSLSQGFFQIQGFPTIVVIDPNGKIRATWSGFNPAIDLAMTNAEHSLDPLGVTR
jgi:thiol-disulfide isomerase/thioredoxin